jgi:hypothetical protein
VQILTTYHNQSSQKEIATMNRSCFKLNLISLTAIAVLLFGASSHGIAQEATSTMSGHVVGVDGKPIAGLPIALQPFDIVDGVQHLGYLSFLESQTDEAGHFSIANIVPVSVQLLVLPHYAPNYEILYIKIGMVTIYQDRITFSIKPGTHIENVEVIAKPRMRIRGRVVFADEAPLAKASVKIRARHRSPDGRGRGSSRSSARTDDAGYFVEYVDEPGLYMVTVNYRGLSAIAEPFLLQEGERKDDVLFTFDREPISTDAPTSRVEASTSPLPGAGAWVVNPANGHAYKSIHCESWDDANSQAVAEGTHLVSINDAAEQRWLVSIFGTAPYWIGLTDVAKEGEWGWTSGEPTTYTHWAVHKLIDADRGEEDYVFMGLSPDGRWHKVGSQSPEWKMTRMAILEMEVSPAKPSVEEK